ncbi:MAG: RbsD/FucU domain-containing protein [Pseudomonadota bacterium]
MLKGIDHRLNADVLGVLRAMGHGDTIIIADTNFPAATIAKETTHGSLLRMENITAADAAEAILSVFPVDTFVDDFAGRMECPDGTPLVQAEVQDVLDRAEGRPRPMPTIERFAFYDVARQSYAVIQSGDRRFYGCFMFRKGVIGPED